MRLRFPMVKFFAMLLFMAPIACDPGDSGSDTSDASDASDTTDTSDPTDATDGSDPTDASDPSVGSDTSDPSEPVDGRISVNGTVVDDSITGLQTVEVEVEIQDESGNGIEGVSIGVDLQPSDKVTLLGTVTDSDGRSLVTLLGNEAGDVTIEIFVELGGEDVAASTTVTIGRGLVSPRVITLRHGSGDRRFKSVAPVITQLVEPEKVMLQPVSSTIR